MESSLALPLLAGFTVIVLALVGAVSGSIAYLSQRPLLRAACAAECRRLRQMRRIVWGIAALMALTTVVVGLSERAAEKARLDRKRASLMPLFDREKLWTAPDPLLAETDAQASLIAYGKELVVHTQRYYGAEGSVAAGAINELNCQNCHLEAGTKPFGNNFFAVASNYPQQRARSGTLETIPKRINDCFERSLNGKTLDTTGREMKALLAYMQWLGTGIPKGEKPKGSGILEVPFLARAADPENGKFIYVQKCASCHGSEGQGSVQYPPLWGDQSYNEGAGLFRLSRLAGYIKANMPLGATFENPQLTDAEAWDLAAFVNAQPRPKHPFLDTDWPDISKKTFDHPFGPFRDNFPESQHKFGPFEPIVAFNKSKSNK